MLIGSEKGRYERLLSSPRFGRRAAGAVIGRRRCPSDADGHVGLARVIGYSFIYRVSFQKIQTGIGCATIWIFPSAQVELQTPGNAAMKI